MDRDAEIAQLKRELEILLARYALYRRMAGILKVFFVALGALVAVGAIAFAIKLFLSDVLYGVFFAGALLIFVPAMIWLVRASGLRWIDLADGSLRGIYLPHFYDPNKGLRMRVRSDAELLERQIVDYERRLSELEASVPGSDTTD